MRKASAVEVIPTCSSLSLTSRIGEIRICSLWRKFVEMAQAPKKRPTPSTHANAKAVADRRGLDCANPASDSGPATLGAGRLDIIVGRVIGFCKEDRRILDGTAKVRQSVHAQQLQQLSLGRAVP
jgi:hypothetical protein